MSNAAQIQHGASAWLSVDLHYAGFRAACCASIGVSLGWTGSTNDRSTRIGSKQIELKAADLATPIARSDKRWKVPLRAGALLRQAHPGNYCVHCMRIGQLESIRSAAFTVQYTQGPAIGTDRDFNGRGQRDYPHHASCDS